MPGFGPCLWLPDHNVYLPSTFLSISFFSSSSFFSPQTASSELPSYLSPSKKPYFEVKVPNPYPCSPSPYPNHAVFSETLLSEESCTPKRGTTRPSFNSLLSPHLLRPERQRAPRCSTAAVPPAPPCTASLDRGKGLRPIPYRLSNPFGTEPRI